MANVLKFPENFLWGSSTSSYQVEGGIENCDWSKDFPAGLACDHYHLYEKDFDSLKFLGQNAYRFSIEWSRIEPEEGRFDEKEIEHYRQVILALRRRGIEPFVGLWHYTNPSWIQKKGGWASPQIVRYFSRYAEKMIIELGNETRFWLTINEPEIYALGSHLEGKWPPYKKNLISFLLVINHFISAHREAYRVIKKFQPAAQVGMATNNSYYEASGDPISFFLKRIIEPLDHFYLLDKIKDRIDFIGLNYYFHMIIKGFHLAFQPGKNENKAVSDLRWEIYPKGIHFVLKNLGKYQKPIYITENGLADAKDVRREDFIRDHLFWVHEAIEKGVDVRGYFHWSLMDNLEWDQGFKPKFGLAEVDHQTMERRFRPSAYYFAEICKNNSLIV